MAMILDELFFKMCLLLCFTSSHCMVSTHFNNFRKFYFKNEFQATCCDLENSGKPFVKAGDSIIKIYFCPENNLKIYSPSVADSPFTSALTSYPTPSGLLSVTEEFQVTESLVTGSLATESLVTESLVTEPLATESLVTEPSVTESLVTEPSVTESLVTESLVTESSVTEPLATESLVTEPLVTESLVTESLVTESLVTESLVTESSVTEPLVTESLVTESLVTESLATESLVIESLVTESLATESLVTESLVTESFNNTINIYPTPFVSLTVTESSSVFTVFPTPLLSTVPSSCTNILINDPNAESGNYNIALYNGSVVSVYCDMDGDKCDGEGAWTRIGHLNMTQPNATCPTGLTLHQFNNIDHGLCGTSSSSYCLSTFYSSIGINYTKVCGQVQGYRYKYAVGFGYGVDNIEDYYLDGISITKGSPRQHIWTYAIGHDEHGTSSLNCPCNTGYNSNAKPEFVGNHYYCESAPTSDSLYVSDPLWDGQHCNGLEGPCCNSTKLPWFMKALNQSSSDDIEVRACCLQLSGSIVSVDILEIFVK